MMRWGGSLSKKIRKFIQKYRKKILDKFTQKN